MISGQDIGWEMNDTGGAALAWYHTYLHANYIADDTNDMTLVGVAGDPIGDGLALTISGGDGANNQDYPDDIDPLGAGASVILTYNLNINAGIKADNGVHKVVYLAFGFEAINSPATRALLMQRIVDWMLPYAAGVDDQGLPGVLRPLANTPNPFNPRTQIDFQLATAGTREAGDLRRARASGPGAGGRAARGGREPGRLGWIGSSGAAGTIGHLHVPAGGRRADRRAQDDAGALNDGAVEAGSRAPPAASRCGRGRRLLAAPFGQKIKRTPYRIVQVRVVGIARALGISRFFVQHSRQNQVYYSTNTPERGASRQAGPTPVIQIDARDGTPIYRQIIDQVKRMVLTGSLAPGEQVEPVAGLAARVHVNPMTVSKAYSALVDAGVLERRRGVGLFVAEAVQRQTRDDRRELLDRELRSAAALLVQLGIDQDEAARRLRDHMRAFRRQEGIDHE